MSIMWISDIIFTDEEILAFGKLHELIKTEVQSIFHQEDREREILQGPDFDLTMFMLRL